MPNTKLKKKFSTQIRARSDKQKFVATGVKGIVGVIISHETCEFVEFFLECLQWLKDLVSAKISDILFY